MSLSRGRFVALLGRYLRPQRRRVALLAALLLGNIALQLISPQFLRAFIDRAQSGTPLRPLLVIALLYLAVAFVSQAGSVAETYLAEQVGWLATNQLRADLTLHCLTLDMAFHKEHTPGELIERIDGDTGALANFFSRLVIAVLGNLLLLLGVLILLFAIDWRIGLALAVLATIGFLVANRLRDLAVPRWAAARQASAELFGFLEERLGGVEDLRANGATGYAARQLAAHLRALLRHQRLANTLGGITWNSLNFLFAVGLAAAFVLTAARFRAGALTIGTVYLVLYYTQMLLRPLEQINRQMQDFQRAGAGVARILSLFAEQPVMRDGSGAVFPTGPLAVEVDAVTFRYGDGEPALRDLSFHLPAGQILGVLGRTGSGKTSLSRLLTRLYDPDAGSIRLGGIDLRQAAFDAVRQKVGMVTQDVQLFHASVRDNLTLFDPSVDDERLCDALHDVGLWTWYAGLADGLATTLAADALSAGEAQLLALARAFLTEPGLLILDEASSRLDPATEAKMERAVDRLLRNRTAVIIAHRLETVRRADQILVLADGQVVEHGPRRRLLADPDSHFSRLLREQSGAGWLAPAGIGER